MLPGQKSRDYINEIYTQTQKSRLRTSGIAPGKYINVIKKVQRRCKLVHSVTGDLYHINIMPKLIEEKETC